MCILHTPDLLISHQNKSVEVWLTRRGCAVHIGGTSGLLIEAGQHPRLVSQETVSKFIETGRSSFQSALLAISAARRTPKERRAGAKQEANVIFRPISALEAILQALDSESVATNDGNGCVEQPFPPGGDYSGKAVDLRRQLVISAGSQPDQGFGHGPFPDNSPVVPWRRGGDRGVRRPPSLVKNRAQVAPAPKYLDDQCM
uniref:Uncharacterized protein n=1 Tax=Cryptomonas curvata TaxID=233186 RepID=A0A7S0LY06_9CRYP